MGLWEPGRVTYCRRLSRVELIGARVTCQVPREMATQKVLGVATHLSRFKCWRPVGLTTGVWEGQVASGCHGYTINCDHLRCVGGRRLGLPSPGNKCPHMPDPAAQFHSQSVLAKNHLKPGVTANRFITTSMQPAS